MTIDNRALVQLGLPLLTAVGFGTRVEEIGGRLAVESVEGEGTLVRMSLPVA